MTEAPLPRCRWPVRPLDVAYHDAEWGVPLHDDPALFECLTLEGAQAGLSWSTILAKRDGYRVAFAGFEPERVAAFDRRRVERLLLDPGIVRHRQKIESTIGNARAVLQIRDQFGSLDRYLWQFVDGRPVRNAWRRAGQVPSRTPLSDTISKDLSQRGFKFVGSTIVYAFMQAAGLVNDHLAVCFRCAEIGGELPPRRRRPG